MYKVSIIIPVYNSEKTLKKCLDSILNQSFKDRELVIVNDASEDKSSEIIKNYADKYKNILFFDKTERKGLTRIKNLAIEAARGENILVITPETVLAESFVEKAYEILNSNNHIGIVYLKENNNENKFSEKPSSCFMFRKQDFIDCRRFSNSLEHGDENTDLWLRFKEKEFKFLQVEERREITIKQGKEHVQN